MIQLDPIDSLALTLHHTPGVHALLIGSGLSRAAGIPTGWEITLDLIRRLAAVQGITDQSNWTEWYRGRYSTEPSYSEILDALATTAAERRSILQGYIEGGSAGEPRAPTKAHHAIARLVAGAKIRVIVTTNFDRLLENALRDAGVEPTVVASEDALKGATPLVHSRCTVIKLHGDYMDTRIRNTEDELSTYSVGVDALLDEIFDRYGLVVVGWSGEWDMALRAALLRAPSRRYPLYWAARGPIPQLGQDILIHRTGKEILIKDADQFFTELSEKADAVAASDRPHPESVEIALALAKKYCRDDKYSVEWSDLLAKEVDRLRDFITGAEWPTNSPTNETINVLIKVIVARSEALRRMCLIGMRWGTSEARYSVERAIAALTFGSEPTGGFTWLISLREMAASLAFHWGLAGAACRENYQAIQRMLHIPIRRRSEADIPAVMVLPLNTLESVEWKVLTGFENRHTPHSDFMSDVFRTEARDVVIGDADADETWDRAEFIISLEFARLRLDREKETGVWFWVPLGRFVWKREGDPFEARLQRFENLNAADPALQAGLLGGTPVTANEAVMAVRDFVKKHAGSWRW
jgi:SIR2-like domain